jgi:hypothetical protein
MQVELAFQEAKADVTRYFVDLANKPEWFGSKVNPAGKVRDILVASSSLADAPRAIRSQL